MGAAGQLFKPNLLKVFFSNRYAYAKVLVRSHPSDSGHYAVSASTLEKEVRTSMQAAGQSTSDKRASELVGRSIGERAKAAKIDTVWYELAPGAGRIHGKLKALIDGIRAAGVTVK